MLIRMAVLASLCLALLACSDDTKPAADSGKGDQAAKDRGGPGQEARPADQKALEKPATQPDKAVATEGGSKDKGAVDKGPVTDKGTVTKSNSGASCTPPQNVCPTAQDECIIVAGGNQNKGMCLTKCTTKNADCPTGDPSQKSICFLDFPGPPAAIYCAYVCKYSGQTYPCPTGSSCVSAGTNISVCVQQ